MSRSDQISSDQNSSICICNDDKFEREFLCGVCEKKFIEVVEDECFRHFYCPEHKVIPICGLPGKTCSECLNKGLRFISGTGERSHILDINTGEKIYIKDNCDSEDEKIIF